MRRVTTGIVIVLALALSGCQMVAEPAPTETAPPVGETPTIAETVEPTEEATPAESPTPEATEAATPTVEATPTAETPAPGAAPEVDGTIAEGEYPNTTTIGDLEVWWYNDGESLTMAVQAPAEGWVGVGLDPDNGMQGADFKLAALVDGETRVTDAWGTQPTGPNHPPDTELGGTDDIEESAVVTEDGTTRFEFRIPLDSGDQYDKPLDPGSTYPIIVAYAGSNEYNSYHTFRLPGEITLDPAP